MSNQNHPSPTHRRLPVHPNLRQLRKQAKDLLRAVHRRDPKAVEEFNTFHPRIQIDPLNTSSALNIKLADAQIALARSCEAPSWPRLVDFQLLIGKVERGQARLPDLQITPDLRY